MLHIKPVIDDSCEKFLLSEGVKTNYTPGVDVALYEEEKMIGAAHVTFFSDGALLEGVYVTPSRRGFGFGDFSYARSHGRIYAQSAPFQSGV